MGITTGICVLLILCGLVAAHTEHEDVAKRGSECWGMPGRSDNRADKHHTTRIERMIRFGAWNKDTTKASLCEQVLCIRRTSHRIGLNRRLSNGIIAAAVLLNGHHYLTSLYFTWRYLLSCIVSDQCQLVKKGYCVFKFSPCPRGTHSCPEVSCPTNPWALCCCPGEWW